MSVVHHPSLANGRWHTFSLNFQLGNIGSEVSRAKKAQGVDRVSFDGAVSRACELFDLTLNDSRWGHRLKEVARARELFVDAVYGGREYGTTLEDLDRYFLYFAIQARVEQTS